MKVPIAKDFPDHHDAELVLKLYELRRETVMREARSFMLGAWWPKAFEDLAAIATFDHPDNAKFRQVTGYWELAYGLAKHGIVHPEYLADSMGGEGFFVLARVQPFLERFRTELAAPRFLRNTEWVATNTETGKALFASILARTQQMIAIR